MELCSFLAISGGIIISLLFVYGGLFLIINDELAKDGAFDYIAEAVLMTLGVTLGIIIICVPCGCYFLVKRTQHYQIDMTEVRREWQDCNI